MRALVISEYFGKLVNMLAFIMTDVVSMDRGVLTKRRLEVWNSSGVHWGVLRWVDVVGRYRQIDDWRNIYFHFVDLVILELGKNLVFAGSYIVEEEKSPPSIHPS